MRDETKAFRDCTVGELLDSGHTVIVATSRATGLHAAHGDRTHPVTWEVRFNDDSTLKALDVKVRYAAPVPVDGENQEGDDARR